MNRHEWFLKILSSLVLGLVFVGFLVAVWPSRGNVSALLPTLMRSRKVFGATVVVEPPPAPAPEPYVAPRVIKALYATSTTALSARFESLRTLVKNTELNAVVINVNDGRTPVAGNPKLKALVQSLNAQGVHTIARIVVFQNEELVASHPEFALRTRSGGVWSDQGGHHWIDPASRGAWQQVLDLSNAAAADGFRELNYDYIRFPSDGNVASAVYPSYTSATSKIDVINSFAQYLHDQLKPTHPDLTLSADIFGYSILVDDGTRIGQRFLDLAQRFDVVAPMVYPSHYRTGNFGFANPAAHPYAVVYGNLKVARAKLDAAKGSTAIVRPWLQDFTLGAVYTAGMVQEEMRAVHDAGFDRGWMLWNPRNVFTASALRPR